eukprot:EG_transcript_57508
MNLSVSRACVRGGKLPKTSFGIVKSIGKIDIRIPEAASLSYFFFPAGFLAPPALVGGSYFCRSACSSSWGMAPVGAPREWARLVSDRGSSTRSALGLDVE